MALNEIPSLAVTREQLSSSHLLHLQAVGYPPNPTVVMLHRFTDAHKQQHVTSTFKLVQQGQQRYGP
uniref:Uncharacterized protein n=1 Tax=Arundo donax TaxID=35708 RepID=A0A0A9CZK0_ARUDO